MKIETGNNKPFIGKKIEWENADTKEKRIAVIVQVFNDKHYIMEYEDTHEQQEIRITKELKLDFGNFDDFDDEVIH